jgi:isoleucyl-tRNA synthetase
MFKPVDPKINFPAMEEEQIQYWEENDIFEQSIKNRPENKKWTFLDGPPFVTGTPHYGTLLSSIPKDVFGRYWTMKGYRVRRVWGWDCHGLPAENKVEVKLGLKSKRDIEEKIGIKRFINECKLYVSQVSTEWKWYVDHIGRWVDFTHAYKTMDKEYMETVMWVFKQMYDKGYIYKGIRVSLYCPHDATPISNFEVAMDVDNYKDLPDIAATYKYKLKGEENTYILAWSTTPWNKLVTPALAVNPQLTYIKVKQNGAYYILAETTIKMLKKDPFTIIEKIKGKDLIGKAFESHYDFFAIEEGKKAFIIIGGDFVTADEGTGVVTIAAYGEEDLAAMQKNNIQIVMHLDEEGKILQSVPKFGNMYYLDVNPLVNKDLEERGLLYEEYQITHTVPTCWRCHTRLYYAPQNAWYVNIQQLKPKMEQTNEKVNWFPSHFKYGRFLKSLQSAPDWCISRSRYWGSPVPVWECVCGERIVPGSIKELEELSGESITDLHKPEIDTVTISCPRCKKKAKRVPEVLDSWIEAGSASFAERHFPFDATVKLKDFFPPDFIVEYTGQIRAWFYVLHVIACALYESHAFKNVLVTGVILGTDGRKMSKNYGNYPDPKEMLKKYGGDGLRLYLLGSPVIHGEDILISEDQYRNQLRGMLLILWNTYNFFIMNANADGWEKKKKQVKHHKNVLDTWILSLLYSLVQAVTKNMECYDTVLVIQQLQYFINEFSTWYIRRSRVRVGPNAENMVDKRAFYETCFTVLETLCKVLSPITPFIADEIYRNITGETSVHLTDWPSVEEKYIEKNLIEQMKHIRKIVELGLAKRKELQIKVRQPLASITIYPGIKEQKYNSELDVLILEELNVKKIIYKKSTNDGTTILLDTTLTASLKAEGEAREIARTIQEERKKLKTSVTEKVSVILPSWPKEFEEYIKKKALVQTITQGETFRVDRL